ncbi:MAG TPA: TIGR03118 family protein [Pyrinomonadaceae bacterium]
MIRPLSRERRFKKTVGVVLTFAFLFTLLPPPRQHAAPRAAGAAQDTPAPAVPNIPAGQAYRLTTLISDIPGLAPVLDRFLINPWGLTVRGTSPFWVANNGALPGRPSTTQLIRDPAGNGPVVLNPNPQTIDIEGGLPTGTVGNTTTDFNITPPGGGTPAPANFIFASLTGNITAWNGAQGNTARIVVSLPAGPPPHVLTGLAIGSNSGVSRLYAADIAQNHIDVFDGSFNPTTVPGGFAHDAGVPADFAPYNIQNLGGSLYVTYAKPKPGGVVNGAGLGFVRKFNTNGEMDGGFAVNGGFLDAPWGLAIAPATFGAFGGKLLVGNFSDNGWISAYDPTTGAAFVPTGQADNRLRDESGNPVTIDELWALQFGNGGNGGGTNTLYFSAGTAEEQHGLFGKLDPTTATATSLFQFATDEYAINEGPLNSHIDVTVTRSGDVSQPASVNYNTFDEAGAGRASQKSDYEIALGRLDFAAGESSKTFRILIVDDAFVEGDEVIGLALSNPSGAGVGLGSQTSSRVRIIDNDTTPTAANPIDDPTFFVRQHYLDFLNREPDPAGLGFWVNEINSCGTNAACREVKRVNVSAAFFLSIEFQRTGFLAYLTHRVAFGPKATTADANVPVLYGNFMRDTQQLQRGYVFGQPGSDAVLEQNKTAYFNEFVQRPEFLAKYPETLTKEQYVDALLASANFRPEDVRLFVVSLTNSQEVPPAVPTTTAGAPRPASFGTARFQFSPDQTSMRFTATVNNIDITGTQTADTNDNLIAAHIHAGPSVAPGVNGPVVWGFFGSPFNDNNPNDQFFFPLASGVGGTFGGKWDAPEGNGTTLAAQLDNLRNGRAYINFHTRQFPGGEIRGNFPAASAFRESLIAGMTDNSAASRAAVLRRVAEAEELQTREFNSAFVTMEYFGYLRRDPDAEGFQFWLDKLNAFGGNFQNAEMVKAFISSSEYRQRFGAN